MVEIEEKKVVVLFYGGCKPVTIDKKEVFATFDGKTFLRMRPTNGQIVALASKHTAPKNSSLSQSIQLQKLLDMRNIAAKYGPAPPEQAGDENGLQPEWDAEAGGEKFPLSRSSGRGIPKGTYTVPIQVNGTSVNVLLMDLQRPKRSDLFVELEASQLTTAARRCHHHQQPTAWCLWEMWPPVSLERRGHRCRRLCRCATRLLERVRQRTPRIAATMQSCRNSQGALTRRRQDPMDPVTCRSSRRKLSRC